MIFAFKPYFFVLPQHSLFVVKKLSSSIRVVLFLEYTYIGSVPEPKFSETCPYKI